MPRWFARIQLFPYMLLEIFKALHGNPVFPISVLLLEVPSTGSQFYLCISKHPSVPNFFFFFLNKFQQSWIMTQCCLTNLSNYYMYRTVFKCSPPKKNISITPTGNPELKQQHRISQTLFGLIWCSCLNAAGLHRSPSPHEFLHTEVWGPLLITPTCQNDLISHACTCTPGPEMRSPWSSLRPSKTPSRTGTEQWLAAQWFLGYTPDWHITCYGPVGELNRIYINSM